MLAFDLENDFERPKGDNLSAIGTRPVLALPLVRDVEGVLALWIGTACQHLAFDFTGSTEILDFRFSILD
jgi:hypothetical protein